MVVCNSLEKKVLSNACRKDWIILLKAHRSSEAPLTQIWVLDTLTEIKNSKMIRTTVSNIDKGKFCYTINGGTVYY